MTAFYWWLGGLLLSLFGVLYFCATSQDEPNPHQDDYQGRGK